MRTLTCPYCYEPFSEKQIWFRCSGLPPHGGRQACASVPDTVLEQRAGIRRSLPPPFKGDGRKLQAECPDCGVTTFTRICPVCHSTLPVQFGKFRSRLIAMIGARETGKTVYMTVLLHELFHQVGRRFDAAVTGADDSTRARFAADYERPLYDKHELLRFTQSAAARPGGLVEPLVFRFANTRRWFGISRTRYVLLSFFDTAGEDLRSQAQVDTNARYLASADGIILLLDPLQLNAARDLAAPGTVLPKQAHDNDRPVDVLSRVTELLQGRLGLKPGVPIRTPIAVAFSKLDTLLHTFPDGSAVREDPYHGGVDAGHPNASVFDEQDSLRVHDSIRGVLHRWGGEQIDQQLRYGWSRYRYFGVSALGYGPTPDQHVDPRGIVPHRVADPLLWLLSEFDVIPRTGG